MCFKGHHTYKKGLCKNQKVMDYRHMLFVRKDTRIKYLCEMTHLQNNYLNACCHFMLEWWTFLTLWMKNTINAQCIISTIQTPFSRQRTIMRKITDSWCYDERNERHPATRYTRGIEVKEGTDWYQGNIKWSSYVRGSKTYQPYLSYYVWYHACKLHQYSFSIVEVVRKVEIVL